MPILYLDAAKVKLIKVELLPGKMITLPPKPVFFHSKLLGAPITALSEKLKPKSDALVPDGVERVVFP